MSTPEASSPVTENFAAGASPGGPVWRRAALLVAGMLTVCLGQDAAARDGRALHYNYKLLPADQQHLLYDPPATHLNAESYGARADTLWWGGFDSVSGCAIQGGTWDFEDGTAQGWTSVDLTDIPVRFRRITTADCVAGGDLICGTITVNEAGDPNTSSASMWVGAHENEALALCWPGGQGYSNDEDFHASKAFTYSGSGAVSLSFSYFVDSETGYDFIYVYMSTASGTIGPLNTSMNPNSNGVGYSGGVVHGAGIGSPDEPATDHIIIEPISLPGAGEAFEVEFNFDSDYLFSDADMFGGFFNSQTGPFGFDNFRAVGVALNDFSDFEAGMDDWSTFGNAIGALMKVVALADLDDIENACQCPLSGAGNDFVMVASDITASPPDYPHPKKQWEELRSPKANVAGAVGQDRFLRWSVYEDTPTSNGVGYRALSHFYPWTCPETGTVGWTSEPAGDASYIFSGLDGARCVTFIADLSEFLPADVDSLRAVFLLRGDCDSFDTPPETCTGPELTNQSPYWDDIRLGMTPTATAPPLGTDIIYQDCYPRENSLTSTDPARMYSFYDSNRTDGDASNANMGDSAVVHAGTQANSFIYLNYRVYPGPDTNTDDAFFSLCGNALAPNFARARMDTAETFNGPDTNGKFATYHHEGGCGFVPPETELCPDGINQCPRKDNKILPDDLFTPGTTIEYFFTSSFGAIGAGDIDMQPDTTNGFFFEVEVLPGYIQVVGQAGTDLVSPCVLYIDAFNAGAQVPIEDEGLRPFLGTIVAGDGLVHDAWDRYDYLAAGSNVPAPYAREASGDNGATKYQSMVYRHVLYNTGSLSQEGLRDGDADLLQNFLSNDDFDRNDFQKGLWLSGNGMPTILDNAARPNSQNLLTNFAASSVAYDGAPWRDPTVSGDSTVCVRLDPVGGANFGQPTSYGSVRGNGCPTLLSFRLVNVLGGNGGVENLIYVDQDDGAVPVAGSTASVSNDQFASGGNPANYGVVLDAWSLHYLRRTPAGWTGESCGTDPTAIATRVSDVFGWFQVGPECDPDLVIVSTPDDPQTPVTPFRTQLMKNSPNPFNPRTTVRYELASQAHVKLQIFDVSGKVVKTLVDGVQGADRYSVSWDGLTDTGTKVSSGVYWARMSTSRGFQASTKMVVLK